MGGEGGGSGQASGTVASTVATVINNIIGAGLLSLPYTFKRASLIPGASSMLLTGILNMIAMLLLASACQISGAKSYRELAITAFGPRAATAISAIMAVYTLGSCVSYVVLLGDAMPELLDDCGDVNTNSVLAFWSQREILLSMTAVLVLYPLSLQRQLSALRYTATVAFGCIVYTAGMIAIRAVIGANSGNNARDVVYMRGGTGLFVGIPITMVSFTMHYNTPKFYGELQASSRNLRTFTFIAACCFGFSLLIYEATATAGYLLFGSKTNGDILSNFADDDVPALIARIALTVVMMFSYPLAFNSYRASVTALLPTSWQQRIADGPKRRDEAIQTLADDLGVDAGDVSWWSGLRAGMVQDWPHALLTMLLVVCTVLIAIALPQLEVILGYKGALGGTLIVYVFPGCMYYVLASRKQRNGASHGQDADADADVVNVKMMMGGHHGAGAGGRHTFTEAGSPSKPLPDADMGATGRSDRASAHGFQTPRDRNRATRASVWGAGLFSGLFSTGKGGGNGGFRSRLGLFGFGSPSGHDEGNGDDDGTGLLAHGPGLTDVGRSHTPLLWATAATPGQGSVPGADLSSTAGSAAFGPASLTGAAGAADADGHGHDSLASPSLKGAADRDDDDDADQGQHRQPLSCSLSHVLSTRQGLVAVFFTLWGVSVMVLGTLTTAGLIS